MKNPPKPVLILGSLDLQVAFRFPRQKTLYRTITYPLRPATPSYGSRACLNLSTNKAENLLCNKEVIISQSPPVP
jgi:hypothetical protein